MSDKENRIIYLKNRATMLRQSISAQWLNINVIKKSIHKTSEELKDVESELRKKGVKL